MLKEIVRLLEKNGFCQIIGLTADTITVQILEPKAKKKTETAYPSAFEKIWTAYDKKGSKKTAFQKYLQISDEDKVKILPAIDNYIMESPERRFRKDLERFFTHGLHLQYYVEQANLLDAVKTVQDDEDFEYDER